MKMLSGFNQPDSGRIFIDDVSVSFRSPAQARRAGIGMVYQHFTLVPAMTVLDNVLLGDPRVSFFVGKRVSARKVQEVAHRFGFSFDLHAPVSKLSVSERQKLEIFKLLWRDARVLILDEPTSQLADFESEEVLSSIRRLATEGRTVLLVSHSIGEMLRFASRVSVLRQGRCVATVEAKDAKLDELARLMVGKLKSPSRRHRGSGSSTKAIISLRDVIVEDLGDRPVLNVPVLDIFEREVLGSAGVAGSGREGLAALLAGDVHPKQGILEYRGRSVPWKTLRKQSHKCAHVPADPVNRGSAGLLSLLDNLFLGDTTSPRFRWGPFLRRSVMREEGQRRLKEFQVSPSDLDLPCITLSGGNLQRLVLARETASQASVLVAINPTAGLDVAAAENVRDALRTYAGEGRAVVVVSNDLRELFAVCDRIAVFSSGELVGVEQTDETDSERIGLLMGGIRSDIVRMMLGQTDEGGAAQSKQALMNLLQSPHSWQRRLGAQLGMRFLGPEDRRFVQECLHVEENEDIQAWLFINLSRLSLDHQQAFPDRFAVSPAAFVDAQRSLLGAVDHESFVSALQRRLCDDAEPWERTLASLTLGHLEGVPRKTTEVDALVAHHDEACGRA